MKNATENKNIFWKIKISENFMQTLSDADEFCERKEKNYKMIWYDRMEKNDNNNNNKNKLKYYYKFAKLLLGSNQINHQFKMLISYLISKLVNYNCKQDI